MDRQIQVQLLLKDENNQRFRKSVILNVNEGDDVKLLRNKLSESTGINADTFNFIFCGKCLPIDFTLDKLQLGQSTSLIATVSAESNIKNYAVSHSTSKNNGSYFVYCKSCEGLKQGKLRIYCVFCKSTAVILHSEPNNLSDIFDSGPLLAHCHDCDIERRVNVIFKCRECENESPVLRHVKRNRYEKECIICADITPKVVVLKCDHATCVDCFIAYLENSLEEWTFYRRPNGFTVGCPMFNCNAYIEDVHHFHLMGIDKYKRYHRLAAEKFLNVLDERQYCPYPDCRAAFTVELFDNEKIVSCPECSNLYCIDCKSVKCQCSSLDNNESMIAIKKISKPCPICGVPTERNGGCAHISCTQCRADWCFICSKEWTADCQWDHWFD